MILHKEYIHLKEKHSLVLNLSIIKEKIEKDKEYWVVYLCFEKLFEIIVKINCKIIRWSKIKNYLKK